MEINQKVIVITGASAGIGLATAQLLAKHGARLAVVARSTAKLSHLASSVAGSKAYTADLSQPEAVKKVLLAIHKDFGSIDVLINNAGRGLYAPVASTELPEFQALFDLNVVGPLVAMQTVVPIMKQQGGGVIINISSGTSKMYIPGLAAYAATKYALNALTLTARAELAPDNIRVGLVVPGMTATDFGKNASGTPPTSFSRGANPPPTNVESADQVAAKILEAIISEEPEVFTDNLSFLRKG